MNVCVCVDDCYIYGNVLLEKWSYYEYYNLISIHVSKVKEKIRIIFNDKLFF